MAYDDEVEKRINEIKSIVEGYLRISNAIQQPKTFDELIEGLNGLIGPSVMTRNLQHSLSFFYTFFARPGDKGKKDAFTFSEDTLDKLRELELELDSKSLLSFLYYK
jgi:hypothetical protein